MFKKIDHIEIVTGRLDQTVDFYDDVLGFEVKERERVERSAAGVPMDIVYMDLNGTVLELISYDGVSPDPAPEKEHLGYRMMAVEVEDMKKAADYLSTKGIKIVWGPRESRRASGQKYAIPMAITSNSESGSTRDFDILRNEISLPDKF